MVRAIIGCGLLMVACGAVLAPAAFGQVAADRWPEYLGGPDHSSASAATAITPATASGVHLIQTLPTSGVLQASPTVYGGRVYIGSLSGRFYALDLSTNRVVWKRSLGKTPALTCASRGVISTAAVAPDPVTGQLDVYVGGGDGYLYALRASDGAVVWRSVVGQPPSGTVNDYYNWSSPAVVGGVVYDGVSSQCDNPFVPGGVEAFDRSTGARIADYESMPPGADGGGVWSSVAADGNAVWATTGSAYRPPAEQGDSYSIVQLDGTTLAKEGIWTIPMSARGFDADFGASPTLFTANLGGTSTAMVGACNKNGIFYAFKAADVSAGPVWQTPIGKGQGGAGAKACLDAAIWDGSRLFIGGNATTIGGIAYNGSMRELDPATGAVIWQTGLAANILGSPSIDGAGVIAASTFDTSSGASNATYLIDAGTGAILKTLPHSAAFPQPVFAGSELLVATQHDGVQVYRP